MRHIKDQIRILIVVIFVFVAVVSVALASNIGIETIFNRVYNSSTQTLSIDTNTVKLDDGTGLNLGSSITLGDTDTISLVYDGTNFNEVGRSNN